MTGLNSTRALITGGTQGLGRAMAAALVHAGAAVAITGRDAGRAASVAAEIGPGAAGVGMDVRDEASVRRGVASGYEALGGVDLLVLNAGIGMRTVNPRFMTEAQPFWKVLASGFRARPSKPWPR